MHKFNLQKECPIYLPAYCQSERQRDSLTDYLSVCVYVCVSLALSRTRLILFVVIFQLASAICDVADTSLQITNAFIHCSWCNEHFSLKVLHTIKVRKNTGLAT